jgi:hypothetical protein
MLLPVHLLLGKVHPLVLAIVIENQVLPLLSVIRQHFPLVDAIVPC